MTQVLVYLVLAGLVFFVLASACGTLWIWWKAWRAGRLDEVLQDLAAARARQRARRRSQEEPGGWQGCSDPACQIPPPMYAGGKITLNLSDPLNPIGIEQQAQWDQRRGSKDDPSSPVSSWIHD